MRDFVIPLFIFLALFAIYTLGLVSGYSARGVNLYKEINSTVTNCQKVNDFDIYVCKPIQ